MAILLSILIIIILIAIIILIILEIGIKIEIQGEYSESFKGLIKIYILKKLKIFSITLPKESEDEDEKDNKRKPINKELIKDVIKDRKSFIEILKIMKNNTEVEKTDVNIILGLESPVTTAEVSGFLWSIASILQINHKCNINIRPIFNENKVEFNLYSSLNIQLLVPLFKIFKIIMKQPTRGIFLRFLNSQREVKNDS